MKKYYVPTDESNRVAVLDALEQVGFGPHLKGPIIGHSSVVINSQNVRGKINISKFNEVMGAAHFHLLEASYVIAHAAELDGAKDPRDTAPDGGKLVTQEEQEKYPCPEVFWRFDNMDKVWVKNPKDCSWGKGNSTFAVPSDFTFEPEVVEMTMAEVCKLAGKTVKIVKEK